MGANESQLSTWLAPRATPSQEWTDTAQRLSDAIDNVARRIPDYEYTDPLTMGGVTGTYILQNPFGTPCEWSVVSAAAFDISTLLISTQNNLPVTGNTQSYGVLNQPNPGVQALLIQLAANGTPPAPYNWFPMSDSENLAIAVTAANSKSAFVTVQFRRQRDAAGVFRY